MYHPQLIFLGPTSDGGDDIARCPRCQHTGPLMTAFSLLAAGFNGIQDGETEDVDLQECGACRQRCKWDNCPLH